jgi:hypothetical protein
MRTKVVGVLGVSSVMLALGVGGALARGGVDPNDGDDFVAATGGFRYAVDSALADSGPSLAGCGLPSRRVIGGGAAMSGDSAQVFLQTTIGADGSQDADQTRDDGWAAIGQGPPGAAVTAEAICRQGGGIRYRGPVEVSPAGGRSVKVGCGGKRWHVASGGAILPPGDWIHSSHPFDGKDRGGSPDDGWRARIFTAAPTKVVVTAVCSKRDTLKYEKRPPVTLGTDAGSRSQSVAVRCGPKWHAVGGGARVSGLINRARMHASFSVDAGDADPAPDDRWRSSARNLGGLSASMTSFAICAR